MNEKKVFAFLSLDKTINYSVSCGNCKANVFANPFAFPFVVNITSEVSQDVLVKRLQTITDRAFQLKGEWTMDDFIKAVNIPTLNLQTAPDIIENQSLQTMVDEPTSSVLSEKEQCEAMAKFLQDKGWSVKKLTTKESKK